MIFKYKCYQYNKYIAMHLFCQTNLLLLFYLNFWSLMKREASKSRDHIIIKGTQTAQEKKLYHICHHKQSPTMGFPPSSLKHRLEANSWPQSQPDTSTNPSNTTAIKTPRESFEWQLNCLIPLALRSFHRHGHKMCSQPCPRAPYASVNWGRPYNPQD